MYEQPKPAGPTIPKTEFFYGITVLEEDHINEGHPLFDVYYSDDEQQDYPTFDHYKDTEEPVNKQNHPMVPIYDEYESDLGESQEEEHKEPVEHVTSCPEPTHSPMQTHEVQPCRSSCGAEQACCYPFHRVCHSFYDLVSEYMEWHVLYALEPPYSISNPACKEELKSVTVLLSRLHHLLMIIDKRKELLSRKLLEWLWWKYAFT
jgi:hypothetical protein